MPPRTAPSNPSSQRRISPFSLITLAAIALVVAAALFGLWQWQDNKQEVGADQTAALSPPPELNPDHVVSLLPPDAIPSIDFPVFEAASAAAEHLKANERVIGIVINGDARAYPINILSSHEIVNDVVGGEAVAVTWCPLCYSALVFSRNVHGKPLTFGVSGKLLYNTLVMYDRETESLWSQLYGTSISGEFAGATLSVFPSVHTEWSAWRQQHPESQVLSKAAIREQFGRPGYSLDPRGSYLVDPYSSYYIEPDEGVVDSQIPRDAESLEPKKWVLGVRVGEAARAYPFDILTQQPLIHDAIGDVPIIIWFDPATRTGTAFERRIGDQTLTFLPDPDNPAHLIDAETGSRWEPLTGISVAGPLAGKRLPTLVTTPAFAFGWHDYFPQSTTFGED